MKKYTNVRSRMKPEELSIDEFSVWVSENIKEIETTIDDEVCMEYEYDLIQYSKDEFILQQSSLITETQLALCEIYESLEGV